MPGPAQISARASDGLRVALRDATVISLLASALGLLVNLWHPERIPYIADTPYEILVPCPEPGGEVTPLLPGDARVLARDSFLIDARQAEAHARSHVGQAMNVPYDYLDPTPESTIRELARRAASSGSLRAVVYGDGDTPDSGEQLARELSGQGIRNVFFVRGGAPALLTGADSERQP